MRNIACAVVSTLCLVVSACDGSTGHPLVSFDVAAAGPKNATPGSLSFDNSVGYHVLLTRAHLRIGAVYLNQTAPTSGGQETGCVLPGTYAGEVWGPLEVDTLSPALQAFPAQGVGTATQARSAELWLYGHSLYAGDINDPNDATAILDATGTAEKAGKTYPFRAQLTIGANRSVISSDPTTPGANPICKQRIVSPIPIDLMPVQDGTLLIRVDPRVWFASVDFAALPPDSSNAKLYSFADAPSNAADIGLFAGLHARTAYRFGWQ